MTLSVNDEFNSKEEAKSAIEKYAQENHMSYVIYQTSRTFGVVCGFKDEYNCDAQITGNFNKKDGKFTVRKIKLMHKCPGLEEECKDIGEYIRSEVKRLLGDSEVRLGDIVGILAGQGIRVGYQTVFEALRGEGEKENHPYNLSGEVMVASCLEELSREFLLLNPSSQCSFSSSTFFVAFPSFLKVLLPIIEIKVVKRKGGFVVYGILRDPTFDPIISSFLLTEGISRRDSLILFLEKCGGHFYMSDYDLEVIRALEEMKYEYFIRTRDICRYFYRKEESKTSLEKIWNICNTSFERNGIEELSILDERRYLKRRCEVDLLNINNLPEAEFENIGIYNLGVVDCINGILKFIGDCIKNKKKMQSGFGSNVLLKLEKNMKIEVEEEYKVDLENQVCECGKFQEFLIPCVHACKIIKEEEKDPLLYVSSLYCKDRMTMIEEVIPVTNIVPRSQSEKIIIKKRGSE